MLYSCLGLSVYRIYPAKYTFESVVFYHLVDPYDPFLNIYQGCFTVTGKLPGGCGQIFLKFG